MRDLTNAITHCYRELYANATPPASFDELLNSATVNEQGQKVIPFMDHEIDRDIFELIVEDTIKVYKIKRDYLKRAFRFTIMLGCSPKFKKQ